MTDGSESGLASQESVSELLGELYDNSSAADYGLSHQDLARLLTEVGNKYLPAGTSPAEAERFYRSLQLKELVLARACAAGHEHAWNVFLNRYRARLYEMAIAIAKEDSLARELADSLYGELYGVVSRDGKRVSKLTYYTGRGSLEGWLRTVLAQSYINRYRSQKRFISLDAQTEDGVQFASPSADPAVAADPRVGAATDDALAALPAEERFVLVAYFLDGRTLAEIARLLRVHESTVSRRIDKLVDGLRTAIIKGLRARGLSRREALDALDVDVRDLSVDVRARLTQGIPGPAFNPKDEKT
jgi:RNA polymerase sigma-70 factor (ECF subfamily)